MYSYALLEAGCFYVIQEKEGAPLSLIRINLESDHCMFVSSYSDQELFEWKRKTDPIHDIIELLDDKTARNWEALYNKDALNYEEEDEE